MNIKFFTAFSVLGLIGSISVAATDLNSILAKADRIRNPSDSYEMTIGVESGEQNQLFQVFLKGNDKTLIVTKEPVRDRGRNMLMLDRDFHAYVPNLKRSMRLSLAQKLSGQVANGDIARTRWAGDYEVSKEAESETEIQLLLKANKENLTYAWIRLWLESKTYRPLRAEYLALNGKTVLKKSWFEEYKNIMGQNRPTSIRIEDTAGQKSFVKIKEMKKSDLSDDFFTVKKMESFK